ncbi:MAG: hypothetical protein Q4B88_05850 [Moraxella sp.]|nr:hypothetical protein [Moraxella sp.]
MCCKINLNDQKDAKHFLGKGEPNLLPKLNDDNLPSGKVCYKQAPALSVFDKLLVKLGKKELA